MTGRPDLLTQTLSDGEGVAGPNGADVLSELLRVFRVSGAALLRGEFGAPWAWQAPPARAIGNMLHRGAAHLIVFHIVADGSCWVEVDGEARRRLRQGDIVGFPHGEAHRMGNGVAEPIALPSLLPPPPWTEPPVLHHGGSGARTQIVCTYLRSDPLLFPPFLASLPSLLIVRGEAGPRGAWFTASMRYLVDQAVKGGPGTACVTARLTELLFVEMLRRHMTRLGEEDVGWFAALNDRHAGRALASLHRRPAAPWTVATVAHAAGLSRSALMRRFDRLLGMSPMRYLAAWRLHLAAQALGDGEASVAAVAAEVGYGSEEGFSRAFKRQFGAAPATWRQARRLEAVNLTR
jgi:AraC-like DNA-binding protein